MTYQENSQSNNTASYSKFDFNTICAGLLFLINNPVHIDRLAEFMIPDAFFANDNSSQVKALRVLVKTIMEIRKNDGTAAVNAVYFGAKLLNSTHSDDDIAAQDLFNSMQSDPIMAKRSQDRGCHNIFTNFLKANQIMKWAEKFTPEWKNGDMVGAAKSMKELTATMDKIKMSSMEEVVDIIHLSQDELLKFLMVPQDKKNDLFTIGCSGLDDSIGGFERRALHIFIGPTNSGKCFGKDTELLMFDGSTKKVQDVVSSDLLMGPDSKSRTVLSTTNGEGQLYKIIPNQGKPWVCNGPHILHLIDTASGKTCNISVDNYINTSKTFKHTKKLYISGVEFPEQDIPFDPYFIGLWIGNGTQREASVSTSDTEILEYLHRFANENELQINHRTQNGACGLWSITGKNGLLHRYLMHNCYINDEKRIPTEYLQNSSSVRLGILAGLIDFDGYLSNGCGYGIVTQYEGLKNDIEFLCQSLGIRATSRMCTKTIKSLNFSGEYWRIHIHGKELSKLNVLLDRKKIHHGTINRDSKKTGFTIEPIGIGAYFGFEVSDDRLFLLKDFTVVHNSMMSHHLISRSIEQGMHVHIAVVEDRPKSFMRRLFANLTGIEINDIKFKADKFTKQQIQLIIKAQEIINKYVKIDFAYDDCLETIHQRKFEYDAERVSKGLVPYDVDIVDYSGHIAVKSTGDKMYEKYRNAFAERKNFCLLHNKIGFDFAQLNRSGFQKKEQGVLVSHGDLAGAYDLSQVCDNIIAFYRTADHEANHDIQLLITKVKDGEVTPKGYTVGENFKCARWDMNKNNGVKTTDMETTMKINHSTKEPKI